MSESPSRQSSNNEHTDAPAAFAEIPEAGAISSELRNNLENVKRKFLDGPVSEGTGRKSKRHKLLIPEGQVKFIC